MEPTLSSHHPTLAFVYDRSCTSDTTELERRLKACGEYVIAQGWGFGGWWRDTGDSALLNDHRPAFDTLLRTMRPAEGCEGVCLVYCWERLSGDMAARGLMTRRVLLLGGWVETCSGEKRTAGGTEPAGRQGTVVHVVLPKVLASRVGCLV
jgi:DNA invertase Pin-like site-specific DNA recombinase